MAIVNRTPDSFFDRGATYGTAAALAAVDRAVAEGADDRRHRRGQGRPRRRGRRRPRSCAAPRRSSRAVRGRAPGPGDQRRHLAGRGRRGPSGRRGRRPAQRRLGRGRPGAGRGGAAEHGAGLVCTHAGGLPPRTRPHRVAYDDVVADVVATVTGAGRAGGRRRRTAGRDPHRPGARLRQEHPALAGGHPPARRAGRHRLAGAGRAVQQGLRRRDARPAARTSGWRARWRRPRSAAWLGARVFRAHDVRGDPAGAGHGRARSAATRRPRSPAAALA